MRLLPGMHCVAFCTGQARSLDIHVPLPVINNQLSDQKQITFLSPSFGDKCLRSLFSATCCNSMRQYSLESVSQYLRSMHAHQIIQLVPNVQKFSWARKKHACNMNRSISQSTSNLYPLNINLLKRQVAQKYLFLYFCSRAFLLFPLAGVLPTYFSSVTHGVIRANLGHSICYDDNLETCSLKQQSKQPTPSPGLVLMLSFLRNRGLPAISFQGIVFHLPNHMNVHKDNSNLESKTLMSTERGKKIISYKILQNITTLITEASLTPPNNPFQKLQ